jgi:hypothetical protein
MVEPCGMFRLRGVARRLQTGKHFCRFLSENRNLRFHVGKVLDAAHSPTARRSTRPESIGRRFAESDRPGQFRIEGSQMDLGVYLVRRGAISADQYVDAREQQLDSRRKFGELALTYHKMSMKQVMDVLEEQIDSPLPFGELAVKKGYLSESQVKELLGLQLVTCPSITDVLVDQKVLTKRKAQQESKRFRDQMAQQTLAAQEV